METKPLLKSVTILGLLLTALVTFAPFLGINFTQDDANLVSENVDKILQAGGILLGLWGRIRAQGPLSLFG